MSHRARTLRTKTELLICTKITVLVKHFVISMVSLEDSFWNRGGRQFRVDLWFGSLTFVLECTEACWTAGGQIDLMTCLLRDSRGSLIGCLSRAEIQNLGQRPHCYGTVTMESCSWIYKNFAHEEAYNVLIKIPWLWLQIFWDNVTLVCKLVKLKKKVFFRISFSSIVVSESI